MRVRSTEASRRVGETGYTRSGPAQLIYKAIRQDLACNLEFMFDDTVIHEAGRRLSQAAPAGSRVILFGSHARGDADEHSDLDFLVIEPSVENRLAEEVKLRRSLRGLGAPVDVVVMDQALVQRRAKVKGTMIDRALREGRVVAES